MCCAVIGTPGIGKSVFAWWFIRCLVVLGHRVIYRKENSSDSYLYQYGEDVKVGCHAAFQHLDSDVKTW